jgi:small nuclear ribonucleoprotein (snRNP)-like protein
METKFTEQQSLEVIKEMIDRARNNVQKGSGNYMIFWGSLVAFTALMNLVLVYVLYKMSKETYFSFYVWLLMIPGVIISKLMDRRIDKTSLVKTHIDHIIASIWNGFMLSTFLFIGIIFVLSFSMRIYEYFYLINPVIMLLLGVSEFATAKVCRFKPFLYGAIAFWTGAVACMFASLLFAEGVAIQMIVLSICMVVGFVIPGCHLNKLAKKHV